MVVLDLDVGDWDGIELARVLRRNLTGVRILATSRRRDPVWLNRLLEVGARGFLPKEQAARHLEEVLGKIAAGQESFPVEVRELQERLKRDPRAFSKILTGREQDILRHLVAGRTSRHMAELLSLSPRSVETFRYRLMRKLGVANAAGLVEFAFRNGLLAADRN